MAKKLDRLVQQHSPIFRDKNNNTFISQFFQQHCQKLSKNTENVNKDKENQSIVHQILIFDNFLEKNDTEKNLLIIFLH